MTLGEHAREDLGAEVPELLVIVGSVADAQALGPLGRPGQDVEGEPVRPVLVATGPDPLEVDAALDDLGAPAGRLLLLDGPSATWAEEAARLVVRLDALIAGEPPAGVVVRGGTEAALAAARSAVNAGIPLLHLSAEPDDARSAVTAAVVAELAAWQTSPAGGLPYPSELDLVVHRRLTPAAARPRHSGDQTVVRMPSGRGSRSLSA
ncbi:hypothetical protein [Actinomycetospora termitidis]|uniref:Uncharacterized protein n=1 Tax=Actinomycetospora termitidis TaxID=3053470 RepID=A0ABT7M4S6_9PSEU|nr:hypothetical protein [Actinomycetospora sp. Odt1-22]MDL5155037.1 hypothetical protein [Actinomycetospora sp. Odt1-22]